MTALSSRGGGFATDSAGSSGHDLTVPIMIHLLTAASAAFLGPFILSRRKGDATHKMMGRVWVGLMITTAITSIFIRTPGAGIAGSGFSFIHAFTVWTLSCLPVAIWAARTGRIEMHRGCMVGLYVGLLIAGAFTFISGRLLGNLAFGT